jgi:ribosomal protein S18 acetylase RimI-like enzyme
MNIRPANPEDVPAIIALMREFAEYEKLLDFFEITDEKLLKVLFENEPFVQCLVAAEARSIHAYAIFYPNFATFRGQLGMYLEDIYVSSDFRGHGVGEAMIREIAKIARSRGCERIDFQVLEWNEPAIDFYLKLGAGHDDTERHFKFTDRAFADLTK